MDYCAASEGVWRPVSKIGPLRLPIIDGYAVSVVMCSHVTWTPGAINCILDGSKNTWQRCSGCDKKTKVVDGRYSKTLPDVAVIRLKKDK